MGTATVSPPYGVHVSDGPCGCCGGGGGGPCDCNASETSYVVTFFHAPSSQTCTVTVNKVSACYYTGETDCLVSGLPIFTELIGTSNPCDWRVQFTPEVGFGAGDTHKTSDTPVGSYPDYSSIYTGISIS